MHNENKLDKLFQKLVDNTISEMELDCLMELINSSDPDDVKNNILAKHWENVKTGNLPIKQRIKGDSEVLLQKILFKIEDIEKKKKVRTFLPHPNIGFWSGIAATFLLLAGVYFYNQNTVVTSTVPISIENDPNSGVITLQLDNGTIETISENGERKITTTNGNLVASQQGNTLQYTAAEDQNKLVYNTLNIPFGRQFDLVLSDGTKVKLNSGSSIKYPVRFLKGQDRKVFLKGEAYFDVTTDKAHPFIVNADEMNIRVLGTQFNLSFYPEDEDISTVLVEGAVVLYKEGADINTNTSSQLVPGQMAEWNKINNTMTVKEVDTNIYTAWKDGYLLFKASSFYSIRSKLERHFNITIEDRSGRLANQIYTATFRNETIEEILEAFKEDTHFEYIQQGSKIIILDTNINLKKMPMKTN
ncbi:FecR family protein [Arenibacter algicola]|uniref:Fec operon regulator FecR n=1 Tax=Arenibacter algicola TaxID=616991 RepID=A0A221UVP7_9FLAO|nr:FecR domain-containing protein [Arenibacter algicola]ASO05166.1 fec operon regulator FecR [Arenibacter algicola]MDX1759341.1 FecR domain-containing protein [Arenibacter algicola]|tara:strand:+ start:28707 stop:29954 length:1248 start_codon:yes stop_codon:yes gene_type:complete